MMNKKSVFTLYNELVKSLDPKKLELSVFLETHKKDIVFIEPYRDAHSFTFGENLYFDNTLVDYFTALNVNPLHALRGYIYRANVEQKSNEKDFNFTEINNFISNCYKSLSLNGSDINKLNAEYIYRFKINNDNMDFVIAALRASDATQLEKNILSLLSKNPKIIIKLLNNGMIDVNTQYKSYKSTLPHHWAFRAYTGSEEQGQLIKAFYDSGYEPNIKNELNQSVLSMLLENDKIQLAKDFTSIFLDKLDINEKFKGKTYLHLVIHKIGKAYDEQRKAMLIDIFSYLLPLNPDLGVRSGLKNKGKTIIAYIEKQITDTDLSQSLKDKVLLEKSFTNIATKKPSNKFKL